MAKGTKIPKVVLDGEDPTSGDDVEVELPTPPQKQLGDVTELEDGTAEVTLADEERQLEELDFHENLADALPPSLIGALGRDYVDLAEQDIRAREERDKQYAEGIKKSGLSGTTAQDGSGADFEGASRAVHPMLSKASIEFQSRAIKELFPSTGPAKTQIFGEQTEQKVDKAERKRQYMNWQATKQIEENRAVYERLLSQVPMAGVAYKRWWWDPKLKRPRTEAVFLDDVFTPYGHSDFYTAPRMTYRQRILRDEYERRIESGLYRDLNLGESALAGNYDDSEARRASERVEGVDPDASSFNEDGLRIIYQIDVTLDLEADPHSVGPAPYVLHIDQDSCAVLGLYRNWKMDDDRCRKKHHMTEWSFIPWRDGPALGFTNIIGSLSVAGTGALRALLDSAHINNFPGGLKLKGGKTSGQNKKVDATELTEIDAPDGTLDPDIRKLVMAFPFNGPSTVLFTLLEWITQQAESTVATASEKIADAGANMPVGTAMALIEQGSSNFRAIHARLHESMMRDLEIQHRLDAEFMEDEETVEELGELVVYRADFEGPMDVVPVSDPNIFSEAQRYAQMQAVLQLKADPQFMQFFKPDQVLGRMLRLMNVPDIDGITSLPKEPKKLDALAENYAAALNERPLKVYEEQDDILHLKMHVLFCTSPMFGANPLVAAGMLPGMLQHCKEHMMALYRKHTRAAVEGVKLAFDMKDIPITSENDDEVALQAAAQAEKLLAKELGPMVLPGLQKMQDTMSQIAASNAPKPDANTAATLQASIEIEKIRSQTKQADMELQRQIKAQLAANDVRMQGMNNASTEKLAKLATTIDLIKQQQQIGGQQILSDMNARHAEQLAVLNAALAALTTQLAAITGQQQQQAETVDEEGNPVEAQAAPALDMANSPLVMGLQQVLTGAVSDMLAAQGSNPGIDQLQQNVAEMLRREHETNAQAFAQLAAGLGQLAQERHSEIFIGPDGKKKARSYFPQQQPQGPVQ